MADRVVRYARIVSKVKGEKGKGIGAILKGRFDHNHGLVLGVREQNEESGEWETDKATEIHFASGKVLKLDAKDHFLNVYMADDFEIGPRSEDEEAEDDVGPDGF